MWVFLHSFDQYFPNANHILATVDKVMNETKCLCLYYDLGRKMINKYIPSHLIFQIAVFLMKKQGKIVEKSDGLGKVVLF